MRLTGYHSNCASQTEVCRVKKEIHTGHPGILKIKVIIWQYVWWTKMDIDVETICKACETCQLYWTGCSSTTSLGVPWQCLEKTSP